MLSLRDALSDLSFGQLEAPVLHKGTFSLATSISLGGPSFGTSWAQGGVLSRMLDLYKLELGITFPWLKPCLSLTKSELLSLSLAV